METYDYKAEERKRFLKYFRVWIILAAIAVIAFGVMKLMHKDDAQGLGGRNNDVAPTQRVYDFAEVLTDAEEERLTELIATCEKKGKCDLVLVTINKEMGISDYDWERNMMNYADDFYDQNAFGYNAPYGDGALLLDNWYHAGQSDSQAGCWLSTSGSLEYAIGASEEKNVFRAFDDGLEISTEEGYARALKKVAQYGMDEGDLGVEQLPWPGILVIPVIVAIIYALVNMKQAPGKDTTTATTYVPGGQPMMRGRKDEFLRKNVTKVKIETSSSSSGRSSHGGGSYGHHVSSGGHSHGGGGHRR